MSSSLKTSRLLGDLTRGAMALLAGACLAGVSSAGAQQSARPNSLASVEGVAVDSLHRGFLQGAMLMVEGSNITASTDSLGRFRLDSIPPGARRIDVMHPILDTIGISLETKPLQFASGQKLPLVISIPSAETIVALKCTAAERGVGPAALVGFVQYSESEAPASGASVSLEWIDYQISRTTVETVPRRRAATVGANGRFQICGLPEQLAATLTATSGADSTASFAVQLGSTLGIAALELPDPQPITASHAAIARTASPPAGGGIPSRDSSVTVTRVTSRAANAVLTGRVLDPAGAPLPRARVSVDSSYALSDNDGRFMLRSLRSGTRLVVIRRLGYDPKEVIVALRARAPTDVTVKLSEFVPVLDTVRVRAVALDIGLQRLGFAQRRAAGTGYYLTPQQVAERGASRLTDLLVEAPMLRRTAEGGRTIITGRPHGVNLFQGCVSYFVDGVRWRGDGVEDFIYPTEVAAIEVYSSNFVPSQFAHSIEPCETVVIWTKRKVSFR
jgi:hypothetical protein